jgi:hypothetical protein
VSRQPTSKIQKRPAANELTAWLESNNGFAHQIPIKLRITATSHKCNRLAQPHTRKYVGSQTIIQHKLTHRSTGKVFEPSDMRFCLSLIEDG